MIAMLYSHQTRPYVKNTPISKTFIDVNYDIFWGEYTGKRINIEEFLSNSIVMNIFGMEIRTLSRGRFFLFSTNSCYESRIPCMLVILLLFSENIIFI